MKNLYICFDDSANNPAYAPADTCYFVESDADISDDNNPCDQSVSTWIPVMPANYEELEAWAQLMGFKVDVSNGKLVLKTDIDAP